MRTKSFRLSLRLKAARLRNRLTSYRSMFLACFAGPSEAAATHYLCVEVVHGLCSTVFSRQEGSDWVLLAAAATDLLDDAGQVQSSFPVRGEGASLRVI